MGNITHGEKMQKATIEYMAWHGMKTRCYYPKEKTYKNYGGRGITVCERWLNSYENFLADMGRKPSKKHSLDRIDTNGNYEPSNCRWATTFQQARNKGNNRWLEHNGKRLITADWAKLLNMGRNNLFRLLKKYTLSEIENCTRDSRGYRKFKKSSSNH